MWRHLVGGTPVSEDSVPTNGRGRKKGKGKNTIEELPAIVGRKRKHRMKSMSVTPSIADGDDDGGREQQSNHLPPPPPPQGLKAMEDADLEDGEISEGVLPEKMSCVILLSPPLFALASPVHFLPPPDCHANISSTSCREALWALDSNIKSNDRLQGFKTFILAADNSTETPPSQQQVIEQELKNESVRRLYAIWWKMFDVNNQPSATRKLEDIGHGIFHVSWEFDMRYKAKAGSLRS
ncbi:hypothetical protein E1B28_010392 [Marasmius oreades]|uniref:Uncharacterized protein n=1 Tax=Marasmius oreades TaxID=181124 RepID=A0A9P7RX59_9AGAR|nr:uncharacterized protein E1B28_010392 [Marasmius oreades]KAG7091350.1 hypothetical protein E1B28_010392 [Marasmius oreades]